MRISELNNPPQWLLEAIVENEDVEIVNKRVIWHHGIWHHGTWHHGTWHHGIWQGGTWEGGTWEGGVWQGGVWEGLETKASLQYFNSERGYNVIVHANDKEEIRISSGCRNFYNLEDACKHWGKNLTTQLLLRNAVEAVTRIARFLSLNSSSE